MRKFLYLLIKITVSVCIIFFLFSKVRFDDVFIALKRIDLKYFFISVIIFLISWIINSKKWRILLSHLGFREKTAGLLRLNLVSLFYAAILPGGQITGETIKCYKITKNNNEKGKLVFSVLMDRITGFAAFIILGFFGLLVAKSDIANYKNIFLIFFFFLIGSFLILIFFNKSAISGVGKLYDRVFENKQESKAKELIGRVINLIFAYRGAYRVLALSLIYGLLFQFLNTLHIYFLALSLNLSVSFFDLLWVAALVSIVLIAPITVLGIGLREGSFVYLLGLVGIASAQALSLSLLTSFVYLLTGLLGGLLEFHEIFLRKKNN